ncbi:MAG: 1-deoxy-D-xylulose-5-phosphate reductoisomerase [Spirochaetes bacterium]|nr:1-deoxy-D-xylulose-5-phosphate reductoisomerase [Spirochaetota bacterium]
MSRTISILGSTGSVGRTALRVIRSLGDEYRLHGLACGGNLDLLDEQVGEFRPLVAAVASPGAFESDRGGLLMKKYPGTRFLRGEEGVVELAGEPVDVLVSAIVGAAGLRPTLAGIGAAGRIALANKETLVMAGNVVKRRLSESGTDLVPVDSEHSAVFSLMRGFRPDVVERIILTASGGSLRDVPPGELSKVTPERALAHPTWDMGSKITIDSATLMNKGLEVIEAHHLFDVPYERIDVLIHPESVVHSMVETVDGAVYAHMGVTDMVFPVLNALTYPEMRRNEFGRLRLEEVGSLSFSSCDRERYPALDLCYAAGREGGTMPAALNAANEAAVEAFLGGRIPFTGIVKVVERTMETAGGGGEPGIEEIFEADRKARAVAAAVMRKMV